MFRGLPQLPTLEHLPIEPAQSQMYAISVKLATTRQLRKTADTSSYSFNYRISFASTKKPRAFNSFTKSNCHLPVLSNGTNNTPL
jgi:hypothetical protein